MIKYFGDGCGLIACDYMDYPAIRVKEERAGWARDIFIAYGKSAS